MSATIDYRGAWKDYRRRRAMVGAVFVGGLAIVWLLVSAFDLSNTARAGIGFAWLVAIVLAGTYHRFFSCPRCSRTMPRHWWIAGSFVSGCDHCGLRIGEEPSATDVAPRA